MAREKNDKTLSYLQLYFYRRAYATWQIDHPAQSCEFLAQERWAVVIEMDLQCPLVLLLQACSPHSCKSHFVALKTKDPQAVAIQPPHSLSRGGSGSQEVHHLTWLSPTFPPGRFHHSRRLPAAGRDGALPVSSSFGLSIKGGACQGDSDKYNPPPLLKSPSSVLESPTGHSASVSSVPPCFFPPAFLLWLPVHHIVS